MDDVAAIDLLLDRASSSSLSESAKELLLAAVIGADTLQAAIGGVAPPTPEPRPEAEDDKSRPIFLSGIEATGFRGIASPARLGLKPGPGLTLVVGRNGSGKSSFVEAAEVALTQTSSRWAGKKAKVWRDGWANVHTEGARGVELQLYFEGDSAPTVIRNEWKEAATDVDAGSATAQRAGQQREPVAALDLGDALAAFRPILSYSELGGLLEEGPSKLYDAISSVLGLQEYVDVQERLDAARKQAEIDVKNADSTIKNLRLELQTLEDDRAEAILEQTAPRKTPNLDVIAGVVTGSGSAAGDVGALQELVALPNIDIDAVSVRARAAHDAAVAADQVAATDAGRAMDLAGLLDQALALHAHADTTDCPVCGTSAVLTADWRTATESQVERLRTEARAANDAAGALDNAVRALRGLVINPPRGLRAEVEGVDTAIALEAWIGWAESANAVDVMQLAEDAEAGARDVSAAVEAVRSAARVELERRADKWQPIASQLVAWVPLARRAVAAKPLVAELKAASAWVADETNRLRNERFMPIREQVIEIWDTMRQTSSVSLDEVVLTGKGVRRSVDLQVSVDGDKTAALSVMSQGELNTLALALFLPRAMLPASPFQFMLIDDPVQSMDAARVDGLARVLARVAQTHQVVVFTHDERLPEACRRLDFAATVFEVSRGERSTVTVRRKNDPVDDYISDALAMMKSEAPLMAKQRVIPALCRNAIEAACTERARTKLITGGMPHTDVDALFGKAMTTHDMIGLALFSDLDHGGDVYGEVARKFGPAAGDLVRTLKQGAHKAVDADAELLVRDTRTLAHGLRDLK